MTTVEDILYREQLRGKKFMMGVSPWFFTNLPQWGKNWYCSSESLWYDRWKQVLEVMPDFVQIITWNDFGESSYISDIRPSKVVQGAEKYVHGHCHAAFRAVLPYLIAAYKAGRAEVDWPGEDTAIAWYRTVPAHEFEQEGTVWGQGGHIHATHCVKDVVSVMAVTRGSALITLTIGDFCRMTLETRSRSPLSYFEVPFDSHAVGPVVLALNGKATTGPAIRRGGEEDAENLPSLNAVAIQVQGGVQ
ncbi:hypothetical protein N0V88_007762 [Collariella sp. IMI 366227]|nr:hypothetical protein N0V88_007762 [Collariella sp. IMI 366227]